VPAKYRVTTLGCKVNQYESQQVRDLLNSLGLQPAGEHDAPDVVIVNTCAVTGAALARSRGAGRRSARCGAPLVVIMGCGASADAGRFEDINGVTAVLGHDADVRAELPLLVRRWMASGSNFPQKSSPPAKLPAAPENDQWIMPLALGQVSARQASDSFPARKTITRALPVVKSEREPIGRIDRFDGHQRAYLKVQDGCDAHCTYCIIPSLRTTLRSKTIEEAVAEAEDLVRAGHREIVVTGIFLGAYGRPTALRHRSSEVHSQLPRLVDAIARVSGLERLRLSSLEPGDLGETLLDVWQSHPACVPHFHLPLQSGSERILRRMNRQYRRRDFLEMVDRVRSAIDRPAVSTDIIVGFPGETDRDFEDSLDVARYAGFCKIHAFPFSSRDGTAAAKWKKSFVSDRVVKERMNELARVERESALRFRERLIGETERVIVERPPETTVSQDSVPLACGRTDRYFEVHFDAPGVRAGDVVFVRIDRATPARTHATWLPGWRDRGEERGTFAQGPPRRSPRQM
jgi:threonylcarbamoyladenosine tRNA methylthiotransferase MtaB